MRSVALRRAATVSDPLHGTMGRVMSLLERTRRAIRPDPEPPDWRPLGVAAGYGLLGALVLGLLMLLLAVIVWVADPHSSTDWTSSIAFAGAAWGAVHRGPISVPGDGVQHVVLAPLLLTALAVYLARSAARGLTSYLGGLNERSRPAWETPLAFVVGYAIGGEVLVLLAHSGPAHVSPLGVLPGAVVVAAVAVAWAFLADERRRVEAGRGPVTAALAGGWDRLPSWIRRATRPAVEGLAGYLAAGTVLVLLLVVFHLGRIGTVHDQLAAGLVGTVVLAIGQLALLPNLALYAGAWLTGAPVQLGAVQISSTGVQHGVLPMLPVLGAVPEVGPFPFVASLAPIVPVALGVAVGWRAAARHTALSPLTSKVLTATCAAAVCAVLALVLTWLAGASVGPGSLAHIGPSLLVVPLLLLELAVPAALTAAAQHWWRTRH